MIAETCHIKFDEKTNNIIVVPDGYLGGKDIYPFKWKKINDKWSLVYNPKDKTDQQLDEALDILMSKYALWCRIDISSFHEICESEWFKNDTNSDEKYTLYQVFKSETYKTLPEVEPEVQDGPIYRTASDEPANRWKAHWAESSEVKRFCIHLGNYVSELTGNFRGLQSVNTINSLDREKCAKEFLDKERSYKYTKADIDEIAAYYDNEQDFLHNIALRIDWLLPRAYKKKATQKQGKDVHGGPAGVSFVNGEFGLKYQLINNEK